MRCNIICGGPAGQGPNFLSHLISHGLVDRGFYVFCSRDYESRIRGGHNFNIITFSDKPLYSNSSEIDIFIALDKTSEEFHKKEFKKDVVKIIGENNAYVAGQAFKLLGIEFSFLDEELKKMGHYDENVVEAKKGYGSEKRVIKLVDVKKQKDMKIMSGNEGLALGAIEAGIEFYYGYPMTPATGLLFELAGKGEKSKHVTVQLESEIAVVNAAIGSAITGAKTMLGTSGGGFDLMTEGLSLAGGAGIPVVMYLAQRQGPATGAATYTSQADLNMARHSGHGEFARVIAAPGDTIDAIEKCSEIFYLSQKFKIPAILLGDKHLADSFYTFNEKPKIKKSEKSIKWPARFSSYELNKDNITSSKAEDILNSASRRKEIYKKLGLEIGKLEQYKIYGKKNSRNLILGWGSTKGAIIDAIQELDCKFLQVLYLEPLSDKIKNELKNAKKMIIVENNSTSQLSSLIAEKTGIIIEEKNKILRFDGRPFEYESLLEEIKRRIK